ncbi:hypothetical protein JXA80_06160 [bacterium]|nr:hypothetical protein [candidate division CSSED10-310 bacterium]
MNDTSNARQEKWTFSWDLAVPAQDPYLLIDFDNDPCALLFDCGIRVWGRVKTVLKIDHIFISHAHIDHLIGFDHIIRTLLGENKTLHIHGPEGIRHRLESKLAGYDWDRSADQELILDINEYAGCSKIRRIHACNRRFEGVGPAETSLWDGPIVQNHLCRVFAVPVDHGGSACHAYVMKENDHSRIDKEKLDGLNLTPGPWVGDLLSWHDSQALDGRSIRIGEIDYAVVDLARDLIRIQPGRIVVYITDTVFDQRWLDDIIAIAYGADIVVCESTFLEEDRSLAVKYHHLTALQAGLIALALDARQLMLFHISSRYHPKMHRAVQEARTVFPNTDIMHPAPRRKTRPRTGLSVTASE